MERTSMGKNIWRAGTVLSMALMLIAGFGCPGVAPTPQPGCTVDADCADANWCNGDETCVDGACVDGTAPCTEAQECDEDNDVCNDVCEDAADCPDDGNACTDATCTDGVCGVENNTDACDDADACTENDVCADGACAGTAITCDEGFSCVDGDCVADPTAGFAVTITDCPDGTVNGGSDVTLNAVTNGEEVGLVWYEWTNATATVAGGAEATLVASTITVTVTAYDYADTNTNGVWDAGEETDTATDDCEIESVFTAELIVEAGSVNAARAALGAYASGTFTSGNNNPLNGTANQQGVSSDAIATEWTILSQPTGSGLVTFSNAAQLQTAFNIAAPALAGSYVFQLEATNENTNESGTDTVSMVMLDVPQIRVAGTEIARHNVLWGNKTTFSFEYNVTDATTFNVYSKENAAVAAGTANQVLLATFAVDATAGAWVATDVEIDTNLLPEGAGTFLLGWTATDAVGLTSTGGTDATQLTKAAADEAVAGRRGAMLLVGRAKTVGTLAAVTTGAAAATPAEPIGITSATEMGTPVSVGTGNAVQVFGAGVVQYPGMGDTASAVLTHVAGSLELGYDMNNDGIADICYANGANIGIIFGAVDTLTANGNMIGQGAAAGGAADPTANANQDWEANGAYAANERSQRAATNAGLVDIAIGDFNADTFLDFAYLGDGAGVTGDAGFVFMAGNTTGDPFTNAVELYYTTAGAGSEVGGACAAGDFYGNGIDDAAFGIPEATLSRAFVIYGKAKTGTTLNSGFAATGTVAGLAAANKFLYNGQNAADDVGSGLIMADISGASSADMIFVQELVNNVAASGIIGVVTGAANSDQPDTTTATFALGDVTAADFAGAVLATGNLTGGAKADLIVGAPALDTGTSAGAVGEGAVYVIPSTSLANGNISALAGVYAVANNRVGVANNQLALGGAVAAIDYNGDGNDDLLVGHSGTANNTVYAAYGPLSGTGLNFNDTQNGFSFRIEMANAITGFAEGDVNGDAIADLCILGANRASVLLGLE